LQTNLFLAPNDLETLKAYAIFKSC